MVTESIFTLAQDGAVRGDQLADEIQQATGLDVAERYAYAAPRTINIVGDDVPPLADAIQAVVTAHVPQTDYWPAERQRSQARGKVVQLAQSAVGVAIQDLTAAQIKALVACLLYSAGAINEQGIVQPLEMWLPRR